MRRIVLGLAAMSLACAAATSPEVGEEFELRVGSYAVIGDLGLAVAFLGVAQDSRCALQAECVWAGDAAILVRTAPFVEFRSDTRTDTLHTNLDPRTLTVDGAELVLVRLDPYPEIPGSIEPDEYVVRLMVRRAP